jgi:phosphonate transport system permease protein
VTEARTYYGAEWRIWAMIIFLALVVLWSGLTTEFDLTGLFSERGRANVLEILEALVPIRTDYIPPVWTAILDTFRMATLGTMAAAIVSLPLSLLVARNLHRDSRLHSMFAAAAKGGLNILRGVDTLIWALIVVSVTGFGPTAGIIAIALHNLGSCAKLFYETIEAIDTGPLEAIEAIGVRKIHAVVYGVLPEVLPSFLSTVVYLWEYNFRASQVLGIVGAGGVGLLLNNAIGLYDWGRVAVILLFIVIFVALFDRMSYVARSWLMTRNTGT